MSLEYWLSELVHNLYLGQLQLVLSMWCRRFSVCSAVAGEHVSAAAVVLCEGLGFFPADLLKVPGLVILQMQEERSFAGEP